MMEENFAAERHTKPLIAPAKWVFECRVDLRTFHIVTSLIIFSFIISYFL